MFRNSYAGAHENCSCQRYGAQSGCSMEETNSAGGVNNHTCMDNSLLAHGKGMHRHMEYTRMKNPQKLTPSSLKKAYCIFKERCAMCHGKSGRGDGKMSKNLNPKPANLRDGKFKHGSSDGEIFHIIKEGVEGTAMPSFESSLKEREIWDIVNLVKTFETHKHFGCSMHKKVKMDVPGRCPICGMFLQPIE